MQIDNSRVFRSVDILRRLMSLISLVFLTVLIFYKYLYSQGITSSASMSPMLLRVGVAVCLISVFLLIYTAIAGLSYFSYSRTGGIILIKYYDAKLFGAKHKKIMLPETELAAFEIKGYYGGIQRELRLTRCDKRGTAAYPPVNISFVPMKTISKIINDLNQILT